MDGTVTTDAQPGAPDAVQVDGDSADDGTPVRMPCTSTFGSALSTPHGRLDGTLVSIVMPTDKNGCNADSSHVHLQVLMNGSVYDVAVNVSDPANVDFLEEDLALPDGAFSEGWHTGAADDLDYVSLGFHDTDFTAIPEDTLAQMLSTELADVNHISVFMTGYGPTGGHDVHRQGSGEDGAIVIRPLSALPHILLFHFATQSF